MLLNLIFCLRISNLDNNSHLWHFLNALFCEELQLFWLSWCIKNIQDNFLPALVKVIINSSTLSWISDLKVKSLTNSNLHQASKHEHCTPSTLTDQSLRWRRSRGCVREVERRVPRRRRKFHMPIFAFLWEYPSCMFRWWGKKTGLGNKKKK